MNFNKSNLSAIRSDITAALAAVEKKHGVSFKLGNIRYSDNDFRGKLECFSASDNSGNAVDVAKQNFESKAFLIGVDKSAFGKSFRSNGRKFTITGVNTRANKYPIQASTANGKRYKFSVTQLPQNLRS
jgi:hypothetical protein